MLQLKNIVKIYRNGEVKQQVLKDLNITFRQSEFVSILGQSGSGKTTMLNIIGGLDQYDSGDLIINGVSTKKYKSSNWDVYRNQSIGFVFQSYNLIPHQTVLANVELALTLGGISKQERRKRAVTVLQKVGLGDHIYKKPNQISGGQMQRVAIARALINNPDIILADEPTGALDSKTSIQIMELLKEIAKNKLVIMVTHNPELANIYATRIIKLLDGKIVVDTDPYAESDKLYTETLEKNKKIPMSFFTALSLSFHNLKTKKGRTILTSFAGSIGIIGIALILAISSGMQTYIDKVQEDTLSSYPITIQSQVMHLPGIREQHINTNEKKSGEHAPSKIYQNGFLGDTLKNQTLQTQNNNLFQFKRYLDSPDAQTIQKHTTAIQYGYNLELQIYKSDTENGLTQINPSPLIDDQANLPFLPANTIKKSGGILSNIWTEMIENTELLSSQYDVLAGAWPTAYNEAVILVDENNTINDMALYALGLKDAEEFKEIEKKMKNGEKIDQSQYSEISYTYDDLMNLEFKLVHNTAYYENESGVWVDKRNDEAFMKNIVDHAETIRIVGILRPSAEAAATPISGTIGYTSALTKYIIEQINKSEIVKEQIANPNINVFTGMPFITAEEISHETLLNILPAERREQLLSLSTTDRTLYLEAYKKILQATYDSNLENMGVVNLEKPSVINLYLKNFQSREHVISEIANYNQQQQETGHTENIIEYTDMVGIMTSSISNIIDMITYLLIGFVSLSLLVSSIMIGIITYISVLERTKEIGILRSIGASKRDISRVFNAETIIVGLTAGLIGIGITLLLIIPINAVINTLSGVSGLAALPVSGAVILILISALLTMAAGLIPSKIAAKKDPVIALRSE